MSSAFYAFSCLFFLISSLFGALSLCTALFLYHHPIDLILLICIWQSSNWNNLSFFCCTFPLISNHIKIVLLALEPKITTLDNFLSDTELSCICPSFSPFIHLYISLSIYLSLHLSIYPSIYLSYCVGSKVPV